MRTAKWVMTAALTTALSACNCGPVTGPDGGTGGGGGGTGGGTTGGGSGGGGGGTGGGVGGGGGAASFTLALTPAAISLAPGGTATIQVDVTRMTGFTGSVALTLEGAPADVTGVFTPNPVNSSTDLSVMGLSIPLTADAGVTTATIKGTSGANVVTTPLALTITAPAETLLINDDGSADNNGTMPATPSPSDLLFTQLLNATGAPWAQFVVTTRENGPSFDQVKNFKTLIWYTGARFGGQGNVETLSSADEIVLQAFLDQGNRKVILFSNSYIYGLPSSTTWTATADTFLSNYLGCIGGESDKLNDATFSAVGGGVMAGLSLSVGLDTPIQTYTDPINPKVGTDSLFTAMLNPNGAGVIAATIASGRKSVGTAGTSTAVYFGFSFENVIDVGGNSKSAAFTRLLAY